MRERTAGKPCMYSKYGSFEPLLFLVQFFTENSKNIDEEDWFPMTPDLDLEEVGDKIEDSLQVARDLTHRLGDLNKEMVDYMATYAEKKASNK